MEENKYKLNQIRINQIKQHIKYIKIKSGIRESNLPCFSYNFFKWPRQKEMLEP